MKPPRTGDHCRHSGHLTMHMAGSLPKMKYIFLQNVPQKTDCWRDQVKWSTSRQVLVVLLMFNGYIRCALVCAY